MRRALLGYFALFCPFRRYPGLFIVLLLLGVAIVAAVPAQADYQVIHSFAVGSVPYGSLIESGSTLYGMTYGGGSSDAGTIFKINTDGTGYSALYSLPSLSGPKGDLILSGSTLYGTTEDGGSSSGGTLFSIGVSVAAPSPWQNPSNPLDVNNDGSVTALDALVIINVLNSVGAHALTASDTTPPYLDVNGDGFVSALDALIVINQLNSTAPTASFDLGSTVAQAVPEPSSLVLAIAGLAALAGCANLGHGFDHRQDAGLDRLGQHRPGVHK